VFHAPLHLTSLHSTRECWWTIERGTDRQPKRIHLHIGRTAQTTSGPPKTERSIFRTLRPRYSNYNQILAKMSVFVNH
jgi:hypothetical protein